MSLEFLNIANLLTKNQTLNQKIITLFYTVRDIPYGNIGSRNAIDVYKQNKGTCSGKHALLKELYVAIGVEVKEFIVMHSFNEIGVDFPKKVQQILDNTNIVDPHNFIKIKVNNQWLTIDATWNLQLKQFNFPINEIWNGNKSMPISVKCTNEVYETTQPEKLKKELIQKLPKKVQNQRLLFLKECTKWLDSV
ncbi:hypothetical protein SAMN05444411_101184 [Lutibacter oricola]|uniref:Transglutaminase-like superfamily protein n=1 Tax=Lutibacter oricola TaxID=762486 RepID=A0A1H2RAI8_9FLAO|nr:hypothetical protein [Lutibacter oricola]SDW16218.1 hypothetical protein SAMN05444411_101184 [Lutibacter oricola]